MKKTLSLGLIAAIAVAATLLVLFVVGAIDQEALKNTFTKVLAVIAVVVGAFAAIMAVTNLTKKD